MRGLYDILEAAVAVSKSENLIRVYIGEPSRADLLTRNLVSSSRRDNKLLPRLSLDL